MPRREISCGNRPVSGASSNVIVPSVIATSSAGRNPEIARSVVVLPAPFVPIIATMAW